MLTTPLLVGLDGEQKMSKSLGNYVGIDEPPEQQFGKLMSLPDAVVPMYLAYATGWPPDEIDAARARLDRSGPDANAVKRAMARAIADLYHGPGAGAAAEAAVDRVFVAHDAPAEMPVCNIAAGTSWVDALVESGLTHSKREARRAIEAGSVYCDDVRVTADGPVPSGEHVVRNGRKHWRRFVVG